MMMFKKLFLKLFISICLVLWLWVLSSFFVQKININFSTQIAIAQDPTTPQNQNPQQSSDETLLKNLENILRVIYLVLRPALVIAWKSLDNSLIYWSVFHLDIYLWQFWNMMKNFANYALGFIFLVSIFLYFFHKDKVWNIETKPSKLIPKLLIAWVWIQASWFIVWALIDISTILVYWVGAMPLNMLKSTELWKDRSILLTKWYINLTDTNTSNGSSSTNNQDDSSKKKASIEYYCKNWTSEVKFPLCVIKNWKIDPDETIKPIWNQQWYEWAVCVYAAKLYETKSSTPKEMIEANPKTYGCPTLWEIIPKWWGMVGPLITMYSSIMNISKFSVTSNNKVTWALTSEFLLKIVVAIALFIPLITLAIILIVRVVVLWLIIWLSPLIILSSIFDFSMWWKEWVWSKIFWKSSINNIMSLIFLPVVATFGICISIVFLTVLLESAPDKPAQEKLINSLWMKTCTTTDSSDSNNSKYCVETPWWNTLTISQTWNNIWEFMETIPWIIICLLGIWLMWAIVFTSLKTSEITKGIASNMDSFGQNLAKSIHVPGIPWMSYAWIKQIPSAISWVAGQMVTKEEWEVRDFFSRTASWWPWGNWWSWSTSNLLEDTSSVSSSFDTSSRNVSVRPDWTIASMSGLTGSDIRELVSKWVSTTNILWSSARHGFTDVSNLMTAMSSIGWNVININSSTIFDKTDSSNKLVYIKSGNTIKRYKFDINDSNPTDSDISKLLNFCNSNNIKEVAEFEKFGNWFLNKVKKNSSWDLVKK